MDGLTALQERWTQVSGWLDERPSRAALAVGLGFGVGSLLGTTLVGTYRLPAVLAIAFAAALGGGGTHYCLQRLADR